MKSKSEQILDVISKMLDKDEDMNRIFKELKEINEKLKNIDHKLGVLDPKAFKI